MAKNNVKTANESLNEAIEVFNETNSPGAEVFSASVNSFSNNTVLVIYDELGSVDYCIAALYIQKFFNERNENSTVKIVKYSEIDIATIIDNQDKFICVNLCGIGNYSIQEINSLHNAINDKLFVFESNIYKTSKITTIKARGSRLVNRSTTGNVYGFLFDPTDYQFNTVNYPSLITVLNNYATFNYTNEIYDDILTKIITWGNICKSSSDYSTKLNEIINTTTSAEATKLIDSINTIVNTNLTTTSLDGTLNTLGICGELPILIILGNTLITDTIVNYVKSLNKGYVGIVSIHKPINNDWEIEIRKIETSIDLCESAMYATAKYRTLFEANKTATEMYANITAEAATNPAITALIVYKYQEKQQTTQNALNLYIEAWKDCWNNWKVADVIAQYKGIGDNNNGKGNINFTQLMSILKTKNV